MPHALLLVAADGDGAPARPADAAAAPPMPSWLRIAAPRDATSDARSPYSLGLSAATAAAPPLTALPDGTAVEASGSSTVTGACEPPPASSVTHSASAIVTHLISSVWGTPAAPTAGCHTYRKVYSPWRASQPSASTSGALVLDRSCSSAAFAVATSLRPLAVATAWHANATLSLRDLKTGRWALISACTADGGASMAQRNLSAGTAPRAQLVRRRSHYRDAF
mmetsp:Transcript_40784/g.121724  ORF Transcript_40784/g.121724 Transcript_40784/m.121724 type:complete len:223 (-) Transcript_40784:447-1115(-)